MAVTFGIRVPGYENHGPKPELYLGSNIGPITSFSSSGPGIWVFWRPISSLATVVVTDVC